MSLIAVAADKGAPGVTTTSVLLAAVWPRQVLLAECDPAGGDLVYWLPAADGGRLDPRRGLLSLAVAARRGIRPDQVWEHAQKLHGGLDVLPGVGGAEQGAGLEPLWAPMGRLLSAVPRADVIADCGRIGADGPVYDLLAQSSSVVLLTRPTLGEVIRLRDRIVAMTAALRKRGVVAPRIEVVVLAEYRGLSSATAEIAQTLRTSGAPARVVGGLTDEPKSAEQLRGQWSGKLDRSMLVRSARAIARELAAGLPGPAGTGAPPSAAEQQPQYASTRGRHAGRVGDAAGGR
jgi:cellulose biosynthesis protein BcsQ